MATIASARNVSELLLARVAESPNAEAFLTPQGDGSWKPTTWKQFGDRVKNVAAGLRALGLVDEMRVAILSGTRLEWILADAAIICAGGATSTIYPSNTGEEAAFILNDSASAFVFAENADQVQKLAGKRAELPNVKKVIAFDPAPDLGGWVISLSELEKVGAEEQAKNPGQIEKIAETIKPSSLATLIYTSGTTGRPKGVELTHDCWIYESEGIAALGILRADDVQFLWLPLSHVFGKVLLVAQFRLGFKSAVDGRVDKLLESMGQVRPTFVGAVPRIFEKVYNKVIGNAKAAGGAKWAIFQWALAVGKKVSAKQLANEEIGGLLALQHSLANKLVYSKLQDRFGGRLRYFVSGSAPLSRQMSEFFHAMGVVILEGYGLTESSAASFINVPQLLKFGTVGKAMPGTEVQIAAADGEILLRGRGIMRGYHGLPEATAESLDKDGWLHTGDIGELDEKGRLKITDRKKDLIKTSVGKYVAPQDLEGRFKAMCPYASQVLVHGNNRNFVTALITLDAEAAQAWAKENGVASDLKAIAADPKMIAAIKAFVDQLNAGLANYERIGKFALLPAEFTLDAGELTPSLKVKRKVVEAKYKDILDGFYAGNVAEH
jgi:long-chain acyl-CoA synthetase